MKLSWVATGCLLLTLSANVGQAQTSSSTSSNTLSTALLQQIKNNTDAILQRLNNLPAAITAMQSLSNILTQFQTDATQKVDKTNSQTANLTQTQSDMNKLANLFQDGNPLAEPAQQNNDLDTAITQYNAALLNVQRQGLANSLQMDPSALTYNQKTANAVMAAYPDIDRLSYVNALNTDPRLALGPIFTPKVDANDSRTNFILSASGINFAHSLPIQLGEKAKPLEKNYKDLYNLVNAAQSFNGYVLTKYLNRQSDMNTAQTHLCRT